MRSFFLIFFCLVSSHFVYPKSTNAILNHADSLVYFGKFSEMVEYLLPLDSVFEHETEINKYHYYGLISAWYRRQEDYSSAIPYLERQAKYNQTSIDDFLLLANIFSTEPKFLNRNKAEYYARKALIMDDEVNKFSYSKDYTDKQIGRLHYILGGLAARSGNKDISDGHLNWIYENNSPIDLDLINHLQTLIDSIPNQNDIIQYDTIRPNSLKLIKESIVCYGVSTTSTNSTFKHDDDVYEEDLDSIKLISDIAQYLRNVFYVEDKNGFDDINKSVSLLRKACEISDAHEFFKTPSLELCELYMRLGRADLFLKQYDSAITWFLLSYTCSRKLSNGILYNIQALGEIADIYLEKGQKHNSILYADEMLENIAKLSSKGEINEETLTYLSRYANILANTGYNVLAEDFFRVIIDSAPKQSNAYILACNNYATYLFLNNKREEACHYYLLIKDAALTPRTISNLAIAYLTADRIIEAEEVFREYYKKNLSSLENVLKGFTEREWEDYWDKDGYEFYISSNYLASNIDTDESLILGYNASVLSKSLPVAFKRFLNQIILPSADARMKTDYDRYIKYQEELSSSALSLPEKRQIVNNLTAIEQSLIQQVTFNDKLRYLINDYNSVVSSLKEDEVAIEFCQYLDILNPNNSKYAAYVIGPEFKRPIFIVIGDEIELSNIIFNYQKDELSINQLYNRSDICELIWGPIIPYLQNKHKVYFSPVGELSLLNHQLLRINDSTLGQMFDMRRVSSTNSLANNLNNDDTKYSDVALFGDIDYNSTYEYLKSATAQYYDASSKLSFLRSSEDNRNGWTQLQHSRQEIDSIQSIIQRSNLYSTLYLGVSANEEAFKALDFNAPSIIHVATHGFTYFRNDDGKKRDRISVSPYTRKSIFMSWTGLLLAGANNILSNEPGLSDINDGILTANEITHLHLVGTNLVVLSACNTGLGINNTLGLTTGLQTAFKMAGAESILMSLWQVPDESTAMLMTRFYEALFNGHNRHEALRIAMQKVREIYPDPYYWGAFVILD